eukprot:15435873-Alexandrium_andersonii.AAC.1
MFRPVGNGTGSAQSETSRIEFEAAAGLRRNRRRTQRMHCVVGLCRLQSFPRHAGDARGGGPAFSQQ